jgi:hypothetical protein
MPDRHREGAFRVAGGPEWLDFVDSPRNQCLSGIDRERAAI